MEQYKVFHNITLAQGILESGVGQGRLETRSEQSFWNKVS